MNDLETLPDDKLRQLLQASRQVLSSMADSHSERLDMQNAIPPLMSPNEMLDTFAGLTDKGITQLVEDPAVELQLSHL